VAPPRLTRLLAAAVLTLAAVSVAPAHARSSWRYPIDGVPYVLRAFDPPAFPWLPGHRGVDLALGASDPVLSASDGTVTFAGTIAGEGVVVVTDGALRSTYEPVDAAAQVGDRVRAGDVLGWLEALTSHCGRTCLHWGVLKGSTYIDPLSLVDPGPPVLLPLGPPLTRTLGPAPLTFVAPSPAQLTWASLTTVPCSVCLRPSER
jgi:murein DD-endopeptidase MepM/ murein hydrolase activator NlpD